MSQVAVGAARGYLALLADGVSPIRQQCAVLQPYIEDKRLESGSAHGVIPGREELRELTLGDSGERKEFGTRRGTAGLAGDGSQDMEDLLLVW